MFAKHLNKVWSPSCRFGILNLNPRNVQLSSLIMYINFILNYHYSKRTWDFYTVLAIVDKNYLLKYFASRSIINLAKLIYQNRFFLWHIFRKTAGAISENFIVVITLFNPCKFLNRNDLQKALHNVKLIS